MSEERIFLGLGSNLGDRRALLDRAEEELEAEGFRVVARSSDYDTEPLGPPQPRFLNRVIEGRAEGIDAPPELLDRAKAIEARLGRDSLGPRWGPRPIDIDVLAWGTRVIDTESLAVPHREAAQRSFVLEPWAEIAADFVVPRWAVSVGELLARLRASERGARC